MNFNNTCKARLIPALKVLLMFCACALVVAQSTIMPTVAFTGCVLPAGQVATPFFTGANATGLGAVIQNTDQKIVQVGQAENATSSFFGLARYNTDGSLDTAFGTGGKVTSQISSSDSAAAVALQQDGKIVVAGQTAGSGVYDFRVSRFNTNGTLDQSFGNNGTITADFNNGRDTATAVAVQGDGKIVVAGLTQSSGNDNIALLRCDTNGSLDTTFGTGGKVVTSLNKVDSVHSMVIQPDGNIVVVGALLNPSTKDDFLLVRFTSNGSLDASFGTNGVTSTDFFSGEDVAIGIELQQDLKLVVVGLSKNSTGTVTSWAVARYTTAGFVDTTFGSGGGRVVTAVGNGLEDTATGVAIQGNGQIVVAGYCLDGSPTGQDFVVGRYNTDGSQDNSFGDSGDVKTDFCDGQDGASGVLLQMDGEIVASGTASISDNGNEFALVRYNTDGSLDSTFNGVPPAPTFNYCMRDNLTGNNLQLNSTTGQYLFTRCSDGFTITGTGKVAIVNSIVMLTDKESASVVSAGFNMGQGTGSATITLILAPGISQTIRINATNPNAACSCSG